MFHCSVIKVPVILATAILDYHNQEGLSRTFLFFWNFFLKLFPLVSVFFDIQSRLSHLTRLVKNFFEVFSTSFLITFVISGERGIWTLAPLLTTYSLSRGAPSASWVFLLSLISSVYSVVPKRREWDSNPRALADKRFSRPPRYDHFDISPYVVDCVRCVLTADASDILASIPASVNNFFTFFSIFIFIFPDFP